MRRKLVAGNWKMNQDRQGIRNFASELLQSQSVLSNRADLLICPSFVYIPLLQDVFHGTAVSVGAQNVASEEKGAFTGEVSAAMLSDIGVTTCIVGHSERRQYYHESDQLLAKKLSMLFNHGIQPLLCCGELLPERESGKHFDIVEQQLLGTMKLVHQDIWATITLAYEPVWAIGTGVTASPSQASEMHGFIRNLIHREFGSDIASSLRILYGGSVTPENAAELFSMPDIDGALVGGASLKASSFASIISSC